MGINGQTKEYTPGSVIIEENDRSRKMYIIKEGKARVYRNYLNQHITLAVLGPGELFGELSFFDAEPRSASVEAMTPLTVVELDGAEATSGMDELPKWFMPLIKTVFHRFREADRKITVLQSMYEYKKKTFRSDDMAKTIYLESQRMLKMLKMLYEKRAQGGGAVVSSLIFKEFKDLLGQQTLSTEVFWQALKTYDYMDAKKDDAGICELKLPALAKLTEFLNAEVKAESFLLLSYSALAILKKIVVEASKDKKDAGATPALATRYSFADLKIQGIPLNGEALDELRSKKIITCDEKTLEIKVPQFIDLFLFQSFLKCFDHTQIHTE